jgi:hypothetical protein
MLPVPASKKKLMNMAVCAHKVHVLLAGGAVSINSIV